MIRNSGWILLPGAAVLLFLSAFPGAASAQTRVSFVARRDFTAGYDPMSVAVGDFNGDGVPDLVVANRVFNNVSVLLGNGDGTFQAAQPISAGTRPIFVAIGDFNGDGKLDLVVANEGSNNVSVLLGNGQGAFQAAQNFAAGTNPQSVAVGDFNGDGKLDLAVANEGSGDVSVLLGNGDGTFQTAVAFATGTNPQSVAVGDFNGDGKLDLAVANGGDFSSGAGGNVTVLLGNGDGTFQTALAFAAGDIPQSVAVGDFNGDGKPDLAVANLRSGDVSVLLGNGDGTFQAAQNFPAAGASSIAVGDFNGDGKVDLAVASGSVSVLLGNGDGTFQAARGFVVGGSPWAVAMGDFNGDGKLDLATANGGGGLEPGTVSVLMGNGDGTFLEAPTYAAGVASVAVGDFNGDGKLDLVTNGSVLLGNADGTFQAPLAFPAGAYSSVAVGDFNGDGKLDLAGTSASSVSVLLGNGDGTFQAPLTFAAGQPWSVAVGDFNGDGKLDLAGVASYGIWVALGNGDGTFQPAQNFTCGGPCGPGMVVVGDFNGDGRLDLVLTDVSYWRLFLFLGNGDGTFQTPRQVGLNWVPDFVAVGDFNGDGVLDLAVAAEDDLSDYGKVLVLLGNGDGTFQSPLTVAAGDDATSIAVGDFNGDGKPDLAVGNEAFNNVWVLLGNGDGTFQAAQDFGVGGRAESVAVADFNGDGRLDLAVASGSVSVLIDNTVQSFSLTVATAGTGGGTVTSTSKPGSSNQINCGPTCSALYTSGTVVTLAAQAATGSTFTGWSGCDSASGATCTVTMNAVKSVTATFDVLSFTLAVSKSGIGRGTVTSSSSPASATQINCGTTCSATYHWGTVVTLTATPHLLSVFTGWSGCDTMSGATCTVTMISAKSVNASFLGVPLLGSSRSVSPARVF